MSIEKKGRVNADDARELGQELLALIGGDRARQRIKELVRLGADVNVRDRNQNTALNLLCQWTSTPSELEVARMLIRSGADVNAKNVKGTTPLMAALSNESARSWVGVLLEAGANVRAVDVSGKDALMVEAEHGWVDNASFMGRMIELGANPAAKDASGKTALMRAAERDWLKGVRILLSSGADPLAKNKEGWSAAMLAFQHGATASGLELVRVGSPLTDQAGNIEAFALSWMTCAFSPQEWAEVKSIRGALTRPWVSEVARCLSDTLKAAKVGQDENWKRAVEWIEESLPPREAMMLFARALGRLDEADAHGVAIQEVERRLVAWMEKEELRETLSVSERSTGPRM